jgi:hypothetical protein
MEPFGARGVGNFPDEAFAQYRTSVEQLVRDASERDLRFWLEKYQEVSLNEGRVREEAELAPNVSRQIGMYTDRRFYDVIRNAAEGSRHRSLNAFCEAVLTEGMDRLRQLEAQRGRSVIDALLERFRSATTEPGDAHPWSITVSAPLKARLVLFARGHDVKVPHIARLIFGSLPELR